MQTPRGPYGVMRPAEVSALKNPRGATCASILARTHPVARKLNLVLPAVAHERIPLGRLAKPIEYRGRKKSHVGINWYRGESTENRSERPSLGVGVCHTYFSGLRCGVVRASSDGSSHCAMGAHLRDYCNGAGIERGLDGVLVADCEYFHWCGGGSAADVFVWAGVLVGAFGNYDFGADLHAPD